MASIKYIQESNLGKIKYLTCFANKPRTPIGKRSTPLPSPKAVDYDLWLGPAKDLPIYRDRLQYDCSFLSGGTTWSGFGNVCSRRRRRRRNHRCCYSPSICSDEQP